VQQPIEKPRRHHLVDDQERDAHAFLPAQPLGWCIGVAIHRSEQILEPEEGHQEAVPHGADAEGTLGGLVQEARPIEDHVSMALSSAALCSNDLICAQHAPGTSPEQRWLHGSACHGCALVAEASCEMRNGSLDRALVIPVLGVSDAAFFEATP
jgi:hypothetical protein